MQLTIRIPTNQVYKGIKIPYTTIPDTLKTLLSNAGIEHSKIITNAFDIAAGVAYLEIIFPEVEPGIIFQSKKKNKRPMTAGDPRIKKLGRSYLETNKLTETQFDSMLDTVVNTFSQLDILADVDLDGVYWRRDKSSFYEAVPRPKSFPTGA